MTNPLLDDRDVDFILHDVVGVDTLTVLPHFADHSRDTFDAIVDAARRLARDLLFPDYKTIDEAGTRFADGRVTVPQQLRPMLDAMCDMGLVNAARPYDVGGQQVPLSVMTAANAYLMAANLSAAGYVGLTTGAAHLIEAFADDEVKGMFLDRMYAGEWTGTMALTEPHAGSSLGDLTTTATPRRDGTYSISGAKIFISGADHDLRENIVNLVLARIRGAPEGTRGISLFAVPQRRPDGEGGLVDNDVAVTGMIHKIGWRGLPSLALQLGERGDCVGWLVGQQGKGLSHMFQMMNEARLMVGLNGVATAAVAYQESLAYARERTQGRVPGRPTAEMVPLIEHADVRRMLLRQKAIVEGGLTLLVAVSALADRARHGTDPDGRRDAQLLLDLLTPVAKSFPAEYGFESNALAVQVHGGYGYTSEYLPEAWLRDQKLNSIHEGTTGIQSIDLLGRRAMAGNGAAMMAFATVTQQTVVRADAAGVEPALGKQLSDVVTQLAELTAELGAIGAAGEAERMLRHSAAYLDAFSIIAIAWQHLERATAAAELRAAGRGDAAHLEGVDAAARYWIATDLSRVPQLVALVRSGEDSYAAVSPDAL